MAKNPNLRTYSEESTPTYWVRFASTDDHSNKFDWLDFRAEIDRRCLLVALQIGVGQEKHFALALAHAVERGIVDMDRLEAAFALARAHVADKAATKGDV